MAVHIKLIKNNIKSSSSYGKYFAKTVSQGEVTLEEGSVIGVVTELQNLLKQKLSDGQTVVLDGIGRFISVLHPDGSVVLHSSEPNLDYV